MIRILTAMLVVLEVFLAIPAISGLQAFLGVRGVQRVTVA